MTVDGQERKLLEAMRKLNYGEMRLVKKNNGIVRMEERKSVKL